MNSDTARVNFDSASSFFDNTFTLSDLNPYSDCTSFYSDRTAVQSEQLIQRNSANLNSDY